MSKLPPRSAIKPDLFADAAHQRKIESLGDPLTQTTYQPRSHP